MSGQVDVGWASPPFGFKQMEDNAIRIIAKANDAPLVRGQSIRLLITNTDTLGKRKDVLARFMTAYRETVDYMYSDNPQVMKDYAEFVGVSETVAKRVRDEFFPKSLLDPDEIRGLDVIIPEAVTLKYTTVPLTREQLGELIQIPPRKK
jgi:NitT/TauT family transport system substrate-binding protein